VVTLPTHGTLLLGGQAVTLGQTITAGALGSLVYVPDANYSGSDSFQWLSSDGLDFAATPATVTIDLAAVNDAPSFTPGPNQKVRSDAGPQTVAGWATNVRPGPPDEAGQSVTITDSNDNPALFAVAPSIDTSGNLTYTPAGNRNGFAIITVTLTDDGGTANGGQNTSTQKFLIVIKDAPVLSGANDLPSITPTGTNNNGVLVSALVAGKIT